MNSELIALFPLEVVLFPGSALPLHIFEDRYKILISECRSEEKSFGINCFVDGVLSPVGCTARVESILQTYPDGRSDIVVRGDRRYHVKRHEQGAAPYMVGEVDYIIDRDESVDEKLGRETVALYNHLIAVAYRGTLPAMEYGHDVQLSFRLAQKAGMHLPQRQRLLELTSEQERMEMLQKYLSAVIPKLERLEEVERVIQSDGYM